MHDRLRLHAVVFTFVCSAGLAAAQELKLPGKEGSVRFAVIGDTGTASRAQNEVGARMAAYHAKFPFTFVIMVGDNLYGGGASASDFQSKFEAPYKALLDGGVKFYAALGNHDDPSETNYRGFNMEGRRYYTFRGSEGGLGKLGSGGVRLFALDSNYMDKGQLDWLEKELSGSGSDWKICFFHHPLYSSARRHGSSLDLRKALEPLFVRYGVNVVFAGHDHVYERVKPQQGIHHFVSGAGGSLRRGDLRRSDITAAGFDQDFHFMLVEIDGDDLYFQAISRTGKTVDSGVIHRPTPSGTAGAPASAAPAGPIASPSPSPRP